jgi:tRNA dimethylallyltransferase
MSKFIFCLMGPTASGKTHLACELIERYPFELISVDSAMIYREMDIGTAKPSAEELIKAPHHLIDIIDPIDSYSAAQFCTDALALSQDIIRRGKIPLLVGGTMMYFNALQQGMTELPQADQALRQQIEEEAQTHGWDSLHQKLMHVDPKAASRIHAHDKQRIGRALEVYYLTGTSLSSIIETQKNKIDYRFINLILFPQERAWLHACIERRFDSMLSAGFVEEVRGLCKCWELTPALPSMRCVGYRQALDYLAGTNDFKQFRDKGVAATRQLAKRQLTWLRSWEQGLVFDPQETSFDAHIIAKIREILDNDH